VGVGSGGEGAGSAECEVQGDISPMVSSLCFGIGLGEFPFSLAFGFGRCGADSEEGEERVVD